MDLMSSDNQAAEQQADCDAKPQTLQMTYDTPIVRRKLLSLPLELLQEIMSHLSNADYIRIKFVCKATYEATKTSIGLDYRGRPGKATMFRYRYANVMADIESTLALGPALTSLTCSWCGVRAGHSLEGFDDEHFRYEKKNRLCIRCAAAADTRRKPFRMHGVCHFRCSFCETFPLLSLKVTADDLRIMFGGVLFQKLNGLCFGPQPWAKVCIHCFRKEALWMFKQLTHGYAVKHEFSWRVGYHRQIDFYSKPVRHELTQQDIGQLIGHKMVMDDLVRMRYFESSSLLDYAYLAGPMRFAIDSIFFSLQQARPERGINDVASTKQRSYGSVASRVWRQLACLMSR